MLRYTNIGIPRRKIDLFLHTDGDFLCAFDGFLICPFSKHHIPLLRPSSVKFSATFRVHPAKIGCSYPEHMYSSLHLQTTFSGNIVDLDSGDSAKSNLFHVRLLLIGT